jgi:hypothetical protein
MRCQEACPENQSVSKQVERRGEFTEEETELLLDGGAADGRASAGTWKKLEALDLIEYKDLLQRNLSVLL